MTSIQLQHEYCVIIGDEQKAIDLLERTIEVGIARDGSEATQRQTIRDLQSLARSVLLCGVSAGKVMEIVSSKDPVLMLRRLVLMNRAGLSIAHEI